MNPATGLTDRHNQVEAAPAEGNRLFRTAYEIPVGSVTSIAERKISGVTGPVAASIVPHNAKRPIAGEVIPIASAASPSGLIVSFFSRTPEGAAAQTSEAAVSLSWFKLLRS